MSEENNVGTTGHQWDDEEGFPLQEFNNPLPTWWLYTFYATIIWAVIYWILYPAWPLPGGFTKGYLGWSMYSEFQGEIEKGNSIRKPFDDRLAALSLKEIAKDNELFQYALSGGRAIFGDYCAPCHGNGGVGSKAGGFPALVDDDWLYGGSLEAISETVQNGRAGQMPAHLDSAGGVLTEAQVDDLTQFVLSLSNKSSDATAAGRGSALFHGDAGCKNCHGDNGKGSLKDTVDGQPIEPSLGAPNLADAIWLYGSEPQIVKTTIAKGRHGRMPAWSQESEEPGRKLDPLAIKQVTLYVHSLGGGQ
ncbi:MAG: cytochrome-c oxidase, cbb3-type subunit III [Magnetococcus sp. DMHC-6]